METKNEHIDELNEEEDNEDQIEEDSEIRQEFQEDYPAPEPEEKINQWSIIDKATKAPNTLRTTFLTEYELGKPLFSVRFYQNFHDLSRHYLDPIFKKRQLDVDRDNLVASYFYRKVQNITNSGMSNKGFTMNLNVTNKRDTTRKRIREVTKDGGKAQSYAGK